MTTTTPDLLLDLTTSTATVTVTEPAPEPFDVVYAFTDSTERPLASWAHLLTVLAQVGQDRAHGYLFVRERRGPRSAQCIGSACEDRLVVEVRTGGDGYDAVVRPAETSSPLVTATCAVDSIIRQEGRFTSLRSYVLTAPSTYLLTVLDAARAIQYWLERGTAPTGLSITPDTLP
ncbi:hypothetical protein [Xylanimonas ulmi]|uniref:Uncharacterized protein n=1 Tax=Xylanimonas ulmi TaxID=228973 RepID=A0A4Q7M3X0_9MICO|nr:hypothetical protein [Xylanibacterium ulmi]RZS61198.1 hypothetical protein EV386_1489 [Xylanibacterium ulmi]